MTLLPHDFYAQIEQSMPIACVDFVLVPPQQNRVGLILRDSPFGRVWCHLGGRIQRGETIADALRRHATDTLDVELIIDDDPQPRTVFQWFPPGIGPAEQAGFGQDPRKHAIALSFVIESRGVPVPRNEALDFGYFDLDSLPDPLWPGCEHLLLRLFAGSG